MTDNTSSAPPVIDPSNPPPVVAEGTCAEHGYHGEPTCPQCPSVIDNPRLETDRVPYGPRDALNEQILEELATLPTKVNAPADIELARRLIERFGNWYLAMYVGPHVRDPLRLVSEASEHYVGEVELSRVRAFFGQGDITIVLALMNLVHELGYTLGLCGYEGQGLTAAKLRAGLRELVEQKAERERKLAELEEQLQEARGALRAGE